MLSKNDVAHLICQQNAYFLENWLSVGHKIICSFPFVFKIKLGAEPLAHWQRINAMIILVFNSRLCSFVFLAFISLFCRWWWNVQLVTNGIFSLWSGCCNLQLMCINTSLRKEKERKADTSEGMTVYHGYNLSELELSYLSDLPQH